MWNVIDVTNMVITNLNVNQNCQIHTMKHPISPKKRKRTFKKSHCLWFVMKGVNQQEHKVFRH